MAPAADARFSQDAMDETFLLTNIAPQVGNGFNRDCTNLIIIINCFIYFRTFFIFYFFF